VTLLSQILWDDAGPALRGERICPGQVERCGMSGDPKPSRAGSF
jgi:hypothetical protein